MKVSDLRIGNFLYGKEIEKVKAIGIEGYVWFDEERNLSVELCQPIPLTKEWLLKFGFKYSEFYKNYKVKAGDYFNSVKWDDEENEWWYNNDSSDAGCYYVSCIKYVHELQNLYFAINKQEL